MSHTPSSPSHVLLAEVYDDLRRLARGRLNQETGMQTLTATALVHEAWLKLDGDGMAKWESRRHFFGAAAQAMRRILINRARGKSRLKRGGGELVRVPLESVGEDDAAIVCPMPDDELLALDDALDRLASVDPLAGEIVRLRFFAGLTWPEISELMEMPERELNRQWAFARAWLRDAME